MFHSFSRLQKVFLRLVIVTRLLSAMCLRERRDGGETVILLLPLLAALCLCCSLSVFDGSSRPVSGKRRSRKRCSHIMCLFCF